MSFTQKTFLRICMAIVMIISPYSNGQNNDPLFNEESPSFSEYYPYVDSLSFWQKKAKEEYDSLEKNVLCEDGINRVYINRMGGVIKEEIIRVTGHSTL